jgi:DNA (cytosine-5)-methyltransferase 1
MNHGSLFSGIGGFDLAAEWMGWKNVFHCEWNPFGQKVLHHYWPQAIQYHDITQTDFTIHRGTIDIISGGFPCQPYSMAGKRLGKEDERHLWPEMLRAIREIAPRYVVGENVLGLTNWNGGLVFDEVHSDLESAGYEVQAVVIPAAACNAPHGRDRVWFVAHNASAGLERSAGKGLQRGSRGLANKGNERLTSDTEATQNTMRSGCTHGEPEQERTGIREQRNISSGSSDRVYLSKGLTADTEGGKNIGNGQSGFFTESSGLDEHGFTADTGHKRLERGAEFGGIGGSGKERNKQPSGCFRTDWENFPTQPPICGGDDGLPARLDGITFSKWRNESIKAYGNAVVPQVVYQIFKAIAAIDRQEVNQ